MQSSGCIVFFKRSGTPCNRFKGPKVHLPQLVLCTLHGTVQVWCAQPTTCIIGAGDEARGVKQLHGKCISCDRSLNVQRQSRLGDLPASMDAFVMHKSRPRGPGWESAPNRATGNGDFEGAAELRYSILYSTASVSVIVGCYSDFPYKYVLQETGKISP